MTEKPAKNGGRTRRRASPSTTTPRGALNRRRILDAVATTVANSGVNAVTMRAIAKRSKARFLAQWTHTGGLNAQVEEAFTGHAIVKSFGRQREVEARRLARGRSNGWPST